MKQTCLLSCINLVLCTSLFSASPGDPAWNLAANNLLLYEDIQSKVCNVAITDLSGVYTSIEALEQTTLANDSKIDVLASALDDLISTQTAFNGALQNACDVEQYMQSAYDHIVNAKEGFGQYISAADIGTTGYTISLPGKYILCESVNYAPVGTGTSAITIASDNVTLDLNGFSIIQTNATGDTFGIRVNANTSTFVIRNGRIKNVSSIGVFLLSGANKGLIESLWIENTGFHGILTNDGDSIVMCFLQITNAGNDGINTSQINNLSILHCFMSGCASEGYNDGSSSNVLIYDTVSTSNNGHGIELSDSSFVNIQRCFLSNNGQSGMLVGDSGGSPNNILIKENVCIENALNGIHLESSSEIKCIGNVCISNTNQGIFLGFASNCFIYENIALLNGVKNIDELFGGPNSILGNWALGAVAGDNYGSSTSTINSVVINQNGTFPSEPTKWQNISMTT